MIIIFLFSLMLFISNNLLINRNLAYDETKLDLHIFQMNNAYGVVSNIDNFNVVTVGDWDCNSETEGTVNNIVDKDNIIFSVLKIILFHLRIFCLFNQNPDPYYEI
jgi:hypothetical protein